MSRGWFSNNYEQPTTPRLPILFLSGPCTGVPLFNYPAFNAAAVDLRQLGYTVLNPTAIDADNPTPGIRQPWDWYMRRALQMLTQADAVATLPGWDTSTGAQLEVRVAHGLGMDVAEVEQWLTRKAA